MLIEKFDKNNYLRWKSRPRRKKTELNRRHQETFKGLLYDPDPDLLARVHEHVVVLSVLKGILPHPHVVAFVIS